MDSPEDSLFHAFNNELFSDFTVKSSDGMSFSLHKVILNQIPFFRAMFRAETREKSMKTVVLNAPSKELAYILHFAYHKRCDVQLKDARMIFSLLNHAATLMYRGFILYLWGRLKAIISSYEDDEGKVTEPQDLAISFDELQTLLRIAREYKLRPPEGLRLEDLVTQESIMANDILLLMTDAYEFNVTYRTTVVANWIGSHPLDEKGHGEVLPLIDSSTMSSSDMRPFFNLPVKTKPFMEFLLDFARDHMYCNEAGRLNAPKKSKERVKKACRKPFEKVSSPENSSKESP